MNINEFKKIISVIKPDRHIINGQRGSEENVKIKFVLPLLQFLGYDPICDMNFEVNGADIVLVDGDSHPQIVVETKSWDQAITDHLDQCLEYTFKHRVPFILLTSGQHTALYCSLTNLDTLHESQSLIDFNFSDLLGSKGSNILEELALLIDKNNFTTGAVRLYQKINELLPKGKSIEQAKKEFLDHCSNFKSRNKTVKITEANFEAIASRNPATICRCLLAARDEFKRIAAENKNVRVRYRSKEIGLEYLLVARPRSKIIGLVGIYPEKAKVAFGVEGWEDLKTSPETIAKILSFPRYIKSEEQVKALVGLVEGAIRQINGQSE